MSEKITFKQLEKTLGEFGFKGSQSGAHVIFCHSKTGTILTVPDSETTVRQIYVSNAAQQIADSGIATKEAFENRLFEFAKA